MLIAQLTDLHLRPRGQMANTVVPTNMLVERALRAVAARVPAPDVVLLTGDLTECGLAAEYRELVAILARALPLPVFAIPGNHDRREELCAHLPSALMSEGFVNYVVEDFPVRLVLLDSVVPGASHGALCPQRLAWLERTLSAQPEKPTLLAMHHPPFLCGIAHMDRISLQNPEALAHVLAHHPQVVRVICGHHHRAITTHLGGVIVSTAPSVAHQVELALQPDAPAAFVLEPPAYQLHAWSAATGFVTHTAFVESFPGPFPFVTDPDYPGEKGAPQD